MACRKEHRVLLLESNAERRRLLAHKLSAARIAVTAVSRIAEIERWPQGATVVTDARHFSEWWKRVGAAHVIVLADAAEEGIGACQRGATGWLPRDCSPSTLIMVLRILATSDASRPSKAI